MVRKALTVATRAFKVAATASGQVPPGQIRIEVFIRGL
jgi:hypothetical protein